MSCAETTERHRSLLVRWIRRCIEMAREGERDESALKDLRTYIEDTGGKIEELVSMVLKTAKMTAAARRENVYSLCPEDMCPLHVCANSHANVECCAKVLLQHGWPVTERCFSTGETALHVACTYDNWTMVNLLLANGADPNARSWRCRTPMMVAVAFNAFRCLDVLLDSPAFVAVNDYDRHGNLVVCNALAYAAEKGNVTAIRKILTQRRFDGFAEPLFSAVKFAQHGALEALFDYAAEQNKPDLANTTDEYGKTLLMSIGRGYYLPFFMNKAPNVDCLNLLLQRGADANATCEDSGGAHPALFYAVRNGHGSDFCNILLNSTDLEAMDAPARDSIVHETIYMGMTPVIKALCEKKEGLLRDKGFNLIVQAAFGKHLTMEMIDFLLDAGVNVVQKDNQNTLRYVKDNRFEEDHSSPAVILDVFGLLLKAGASADNLSGLLDTLRGWDCFGWNCFRNKAFSEDIAELLWRFSTQNHWNAVSRNLLGLEPVPRLPSLRHSCRSAVRGALLATGRFHSMRGVNIYELGLPRELQRYVTFSQD